MQWPGKGPGTFEQELGDLEQRLMLTTVEKAVAWSQASSVWPDTFGLACCAIEMMSIVSARYDVARFGAEVFRSSPRQADLLIVSGRVAHKMAAPLRQIYDQMLEPKWVIAMGACASSGGMFNNYTDPPGRGQGRRRGHPRPRLPAAAGGADRGDRPAAGEDQGGRAAGVRDPGRGVLTYEGVPGLVETREAYGETTLVVDPARLVEACRHLRDEEGFSMLADVTPTDYLGWGSRGRRRLHRQRRRAAT